MFESQPGWLSGSNGRKPLGLGTEEARWHLEGEHKRRSWSVTPGALEDSGDLPRATLWSRAGLALNSGLLAPPLG